MEGGVTSDDTAQYCSLNDAWHGLKCGPSGIEGRDWTPIFTLIRNGALSALRCETAPAHVLPALAGDVVLNDDFWASVSKHYRMSSDSWKEWITAGGIKVSIADAEAIAERNERDKRIYDERYCRNTFQYLWPGTHVLAWIIARSDNAITAILDGQDGVGGDPRSAWESLLLIAEEHRLPEDESCHHVLWRAFDELAQALQGERLKAWRCEKRRSDVVEIKATDFMQAGLMEGQNSCGLLGAGKSGSLFVLMRRDDVKALWPVLAKAELPTAPVPDRSGGAKPSNNATATKRKRPGPLPDPDWPEAVATVTASCIAAGYQRPLKRGGKAAIQTMLLTAMAEKGKYPSEDTAAKYATEVIAALPDS